MPKGTKEPQEVKQRIQRTEDRRFPLPGRRCIHLDGDTIIHLVPPSLLTAQDPFNNPGSSLCEQLRITSRVRPSAPSLPCGRQKHTCRITCCLYRSLRDQKRVIARDTRRITGVVLTCFYV